MWWAHTINPKTPIENIGRGQNIFVYLALRTVRDSFLSYGSQVNNASFI
jgi:hypothetical protein